MKEMVIKEKSKHLLMIVGVMALVTLMFIGFMCYANGKANSDLPLRGSIECTNSDFCTKEDYEGMFAVVLVGAIFFGGTTLFFIFRFVSNKPLLTIKGDGLSYKTGVRKVLFIPWNQIKEIYRSKIFNEEVMIFELSDYESFKQTLNQSDMKALEKRNRFNVHPLFISKRACNMEFPELLEVLSSYHSGVNKEYK